MRRRRVQLLAIAALAVAAAPAHASPLGTWDRGAQATVKRAGLMGGGAFSARLGAHELDRALRALAARRSEPVRAHIAGNGPVTVAQLDAALVRQLGLGDVAGAVQRDAARARLQPPGRFGTEVVARQLGLRTDHPASQDAIELLPSDPVTRAEAAWSFAQILAFDGWETQDAREVLGRFQLPQYTPAQLAPLRIAVSRIGYPYVWGGESDGTYSDIGGSQPHGGFDCTGLIWRVFKLGGLPAGRRIQGRTAAQMAGEFPRAQRIRFGAIRPADLLFFGSAKFGGRATESSVWHAGIALSRDFMIHSSSQGVYVSPLWETWRRSEFSWARRVVGR